MALKKLCRCGKLINYTDKYCNECNKKVEQEKTDRAKRYDREVRNSDSNKRYADFYNSKAWRTLSDLIKKEYNGMCVMSYFEDDEIVESDVVHHIEPLKERWDLRLVKDNLIPLSHTHHNNIEVNYSEKEKEKLKKLMERWEEIYG